MIERIAYGGANDDELAKVIGQWIIEQHRRDPGERICTGFMIDDLEVMVGTLGFAHGESEPELARARKNGTTNRTWRRIFPGRQSGPKRGAL